jgi:hypothetical protein
VIGIHNWKLIQHGNNNAILLFNLFLCTALTENDGQDHFSVIWRGKLVVTSAGKANTVLLNKQARILEYGSLFDQFHLYSMSI